MEWNCQPTDSEFGNLFLGIEQKQPLEMKTVVVAGQKLRVESIHRENAQTQHSTGWIVFDVRCLVTLMWF